MSKMVTMFGMLQRRGELRFLDEAAAPLGVGDAIGRQHLQRDQPVQPVVAGPIDLAHPADAQQVDDPIRSEVSARLERHAAAANSIAGRVDALSTPTACAILGRTMSPAIPDETDDERFRRVAAIFDSAGFLAHPRYPPRRGRAPAPVRHP